jgi:hypothetical protein
MNNMLVHSLAFMGIVTEVMSIIECQQVSDKCVQKKVDPSPYPIIMIGAAHAQSAYGSPNSFHHPHQQIPTELLSQQSPHHPHYQKSFQPIHQAFQPSSFAFSNNTTAHSPSFPASSFPSTPTSSFSSFSENIRDYEIWHDYRSLEECGTGVYGKVYKAQRRSDGMIVAIKETAKHVQEGVDATTYRELNALALFKTKPHNFIIR